MMMPAQQYDQMVKTASRQSLRATPSIGTASEAL